jgi:hypothetical protein
MVLNLPLDECIDNTHTKVTREKRKGKEMNKKKLQQVRTMCGSRTGGWSLPCVMSD